MSNLLTVSMTHNSLDVLFGRTMAAHKVNMGTEWCVSDTTSRYASMVAHHDIATVLPNSTSRELCVMDTVSRLDILNINFDPGILETQWVMKSVSKAVDSVMRACLNTTGNPEDQDSDQ